jgi:uncharacterized protein YecT (DUF1311 family)
MKKTLLALFLVFCCTQLSFSQAREDATGETGLYREYEKADKELNVVYNKLKKKLSKADQIALTNAQKDWIKFRDSNCKFKSYAEGEGGVIANKMNIDCLRQATISRTKELKGLIEGF